MGPAVPNLDTIALTSAVTSKVTENEACATSELSRAPTFPATTVDAIQEWSSHSETQYRSKFPSFFFWLSQSTAHVQGGPPPLPSWPAVDCKTKRMYVAAIAAVLL